MKWKLIGVIPDQELHADSNRMLQLTIIVVAVCAILGSLVAYMISRLISKPIEEQIRLQSLLEQGDLTVRNHSRSRIRDVQDLSDSFNGMVERFSILLARLRETSVVLKKSSKDLGEQSDTTKEIVGQVVTAIDEIAQGTGSQAEETAEGLELARKLSEDIEVVQVSCDTLKVSSQEVDQIVGEGRGAMAELKGKSSQSSHIISEVTQSIHDLSESVQEIHQIIKSITEISKQTKLLTLNASIEAARAGEHGKGFAVVAQEVGKLAVISAESTDNIVEIIAGVQERVSATVQKTEQAIGIFHEQDQVVSSTQQSFENINSSLETNLIQVDALTQAVLTMSSSKERILSAYESISAITQQTAASSEQVAGSSQEEQQIIDKMSEAIIQLDQLANELNESIEVFKLEKETETP